MSVPTVMMKLCIAIHSKPVLEAQGLGNRGLRVGTTVSGVVLTSLGGKTPRGDKCIEATANDLKDQNRSNRNGILTLNAPLLAGFEVAGRDSAVVAVVGTIVRALSGESGLTVMVLPP